MAHRRVIVLGLVLALAATSACYSMRPSRGGGRAHASLPRRVDPADVAVPDGYRVDVVATGLTFPTSVTFDDDGRLYVVESGYSYGEAFDTPKLLRVEPGGGTTVIATGGNGPWSGVVHQ